MNYNEILDRNKIKNEIGKTLQIIQTNKQDVAHKRGIYIYGNAGVGKTTFINNILKECGYDVIRYDAGDMRNKSIIAIMTKSNMSDQNVISMFYKKAQPIAIMMDDIDGMNNGDKGGINALIKLIRPKKTKKQQGEDTITNPVVCIGNCMFDKKIKELMKVCYCYEIPTPTTEQVLKLIQYKSVVCEPHVIPFIKGDLNKLDYIHRLYKTNPTVLNHYLTTHQMEQQRSYEDVKDITTRLLKGSNRIIEHNSIMNETDRTIISLLWHENIIDCISKMPNEDMMILYNDMLNIFCFGDYIDRITFQHQIWQMNEMSSLLKTFYNNYIYHNRTQKMKTIVPREIRFTKVLTKYSTEYNNQNFIFSMCDKLSMEKKDLLTFATENTRTCDTIAVFAHHDISKLDVERLHRYISAFV